GREVGGGGGAVSAGLKTRPSTTLTGTDIPGMETRQTAQINDDLLRRLFRTTWPFYCGAIVFGAVVAAAVAAFGYQVWNGIGRWGIDRPVFWAFDITNFVFWIGISHAGTLLSAI